MCTVIPVSDILLFCDNSRDRVGRPIILSNPGAAGTGKPHDRLSMVRAQRFTAWTIYVFEYAVS